MDQSGGALLRSHRRETDETGCSQVGQAADRSHPRPSFRSTITTRNPCAGPSRQTIFWRPSSASANARSTFTLKLDSQAARSAVRPGERAMFKVKRLRTADCGVDGFRYASNARSWDPSYLAFTRAGA